MAKRKLVRTSGVNPVCFIEFLRSVGLLETLGMLVNRPMSQPLCQVIHQFARFKSRQETLFCAYKALNITGEQAFHHKGKQGGGAKERLLVHKLVFDAITVVMQYNMESGRSLLKV